LKIANDFVIPAKAGIQAFSKWLILNQETLDPGLRRGDVYRVFALMWEFQSILTAVLVRQGGNR
jgi:hypothetical protein